MSTDTPIVVSMTSEALWRKCYELENEQKVGTSVCKIFPELKYSIAGLDPDKLYSMTIHFERTDNHMLKWHRKRYREVPSTVSRKDSREYKRGNEQLGSFWMKNDVDFTNVRITCEKTTEDRQPFYILLNPNHRYIPVLTVREGKHVIHMVKLDYTEFAAVLCFHNDAIREIKQNQRSRRNRFHGSITGIPPLQVTSNFPRPQSIHQLCPPFFLLPLDINTIIPLLHISVVPLTNLPHPMLLNPVIQTLCQMIRVSPNNFTLSHILQYFSLFKTLISYQVSINNLVSNFLSLPSPTISLSDNSNPVQVNTDSIAVTRIDDVDIIN